MESREWYITHASSHVMSCDVRRRIERRDIGREPHMLADEWVIHEPVREPNMDQTLQATYVVNDDINDFPPFHLHSGM